MSIVRFITAIIFLFALATSAVAQTEAKSTDECRKHLPRNWGPNFGEQWHHYEAIFWACRSGLTTTAVEKLRQTANVTGLIQDMMRVTIDNQELILIGQVEGSMRCHSFAALKKTETAWERIWDEASDIYCMMSCPPIRMKVKGTVLILRSEASSDRQCKGIFHRSEFVWNGKTFERKTSVNGS